MEYPNVTRLYKFYAYNEYSLSVLIDKMVWFSKPATLNDPFDIDIDFDICMSPSKLRYMINVVKKQPGISTQKREALRDLEKENANPDAHNKIKGLLNNQFREDRKNWGVFCMSESKRDILMWSHYADHHKGFCVELLRSPESPLGDLEKTRPVTYSCEYPTPDPTADNKMFYDELFFTKAKGWAHEKEWRMLNDKGDILEPLPGAITAVIFGLKMPSQHRAKIKNILSKTPEIKYQRAEKVPNQFKLKIVDCESNHTLERKGKSCEMQFQSGIPLIKCQKRQK